MAGISFTGLASGIDSGKLIDQLVALETARATTLQNRQSDLNTQKSIVGTLTSLVSTLATKARALDISSEVTPKTATSSDARVAVAVSSNAASATHTVRTQQLATTQVTSSKTFATQAAGVLGTGSVQITVGGASNTVSWSASDSLTDVADRITSAGAGVSASVLFDGSTFRLVVTADGSGTAGAPTFVDSGSGLDLSLAGNVKVPARDAIVTIDGVDVTRSKNVIDDALAGVTLTLSAKPAATDPDTTITIGLDSKGLKDKVKGLVDAFNGLNASLHVQLDYNGTTKGTNTLFGDATLRQLQGALATVASSEYAGSTLGALGISRDKTGAMTFDEAKFDAALAKDSNAVNTVFVTGGFATALTGLADTFTQTGTGLFATKTQALTDRGADLQKQIDVINRNADNLRTRLEKQFQALEEAMSKLQSQSSFISKII
jgi:flagellar hook-associated protein 2